MTFAADKMVLHYRLIEKIGEGGMGVVWSAVDTTLDRQVAIKLLPQGIEADPERLARFEREAKLLASLNHPNIAAIYGLHSDGAERFLAMELVAGEDLAERLFAWLPDSRRLTYWSASDHALYTWDIETDERERVEGAGTTPGTPMLSPDGETLYMLEENVDGEIWMLTLTGAGD